jgi:excisionase family DNA binding protein
MSIPVSKPPAESPGLPQLVKPRTAALIVDVHQNTIYNAIYRGDLKAYRYGARAIRIDVADLLALFTPYVGGEYGVWQSVGVR